MREVPISEALSLKYPEWVMWVITTDAEGVPNLMPAGWVMQCNATPPMLAVAVSMSAYTHQSLEETGEFVLAWPGAGQEEIIAQAGECSGREVDKFATFELQTVPGQHLGVPLVEGCAAAFECVVVSQLELEDHSVFIGEIMGAHVADPAVAKLENFDGEFAVAQPAE